jgi:hypothetical protein
MARSDPLADLMHMVIPAVIGIVLLLCGLSPDVETGKVLLMPLVFLGFISLFLTGWKWGRRLPVIAGFLIFTVALSTFIGGFGRRWEFGTLGAPRELIAADGLHYTDGTPVDDVSRGMNKGGFSTEKAYLFVVFPLFLWWLCGDLIPAIRGRHPHRRRN